MLGTLKVIRSQYECLRGSIFQGQVSQFPQVNSSFNVYEVFNAAKHLTQNHRKGIQVSMIKVVTTEHPLEYFFATDDTEYHLKITDLNA